MSSSTKRVLKLVITAGDTTCFTKDKKRCCYVRTGNFGQIFMCSLFNHQEIKDANGTLSGPGWLQRLPECLAAENER